MDGLLGMQVSDHGADRGLVARLALRIVAQMAGTNQVETGAPRSDVTRMLARAARSGDPRMFQQLQDEFRRSKISASRVIDDYIPAAVTLLGAAWHRDEITVLQATLAFARLQDLLRELGAVITADTTGRPDGARVLLAMPSGEQHTISALLATSRLRRLGVSVWIEFMAEPEETARLLSEQRFDALFLSCANRTAVPTCEGIIKSVRRLGQTGLSVVIGGPIVNLEPDRVACLGADHATTSVDDALMACGLLASCVAAQ